MMNKTNLPAVVMQIIPSLDSGGAERTVLEMTEALVKAGGRSVVVSEGGRLVPDIEAAGGEFIAFPAATKNPLKIISNGRLLAKLARGQNVSILHARSRAPAWSAKLAARHAGLHFMTTYHGAYGEEKIEPLKTLKNSYNGVMASGERVIANSRYIAERIRSRHQTGDDRLRVIYRGVDIEQFDAARVPAKRVEALRAAWQIAPGERVILVPGRLSPLKGQSVVISAVQKLAARGQLDNTAVIFAGSAQGRDSYVAGLAAQISAAGLGDRVRMVGHCGDMPAAYKLATVTIAGSTVRAEAFGRTAAESQAMGCPVVAANLGAPSEVVRDPGRFGIEQATGWLMPPNDADKLAEILEHIATLPEAALAAMRAQARKNIVENFSLTQMKRETLAVYDELLKSNLAARFAAA